MNNQPYDNRASKIYYGKKFKPYGDKWVLIGLRDYVSLKSLQEILKDNNIKYSESMKKEQLVNGVFEIYKRTNNSGKSDIEKYIYAARYAKDKKRNDPFMKKIDSFFAYLMTNNVYRIKVNPSTASKVIAAISVRNIEELDDIKSEMKSAICKNKEEFNFFDLLFENWFIQDYGVTSSDYTKKSLNDKRQVKINAAPNMTLEEFDNEIANIFAQAPSSEVRDDEGNAGESNSNTSDNNPFGDMFDGGNENESNSQNTDNDNSNNSDNGNENDDGNSEESGNDEEGNSTDSDTSEQNTETKDEDNTTDTEQENGDGDSNSDEINGDEDGNGEDGTDGENNNDDSDESTQSDGDGISDDSNESNEQSNDESENGDSEGVNDNGNESDNDGTEEGDSSNGDGQANDRENGDDSTDGDNDISNNQNGQSDENGNDSGESGSDSDSGEGESDENMGDESNSNGESGNSDGDKQDGDSDGDGTDSDGGNSDTNDEGSDSNGENESGNDDNSTGDDGTTSESNDGNSSNGDNSEQESGNDSGNEKTSGNAGNDSEQGNDSHEGQQSGSDNINNDSSQQGEQSNSEGQQSDSNGQQSSSNSSSSQSQSGEQGEQGEQSGGDSGDSGEQQGQESQSQDEQQSGGGESGEQGEQSDSQDSSGDGQGEPQFGQQEPQEPDNSSGTPPMPDVKCPKCGSSRIVQDSEETQYTIDIYMKCEDCGWKQLISRLPKSNNIEDKVKIALIEDGNILQLGAFVGFSPQETLARIDKVKMVVSGSADARGALGTAAYTKEPHMWTRNGDDWILTMSVMSSRAIDKYLDADEKPYLYWQSIYTFQHEFLHVFNDVPPVSLHQKWDEAYVPLIHTIFLRHEGGALNPILLTEIAEQFLDRMHMQKTPEDRPKYDAKTFKYFDQFITFYSSSPQRFMEFIRRAFQNHMTDDEIEVEIYKAYRIWEM